MRVEKAQTDSSLLSALQEPSLYPGKPAQVVHRETYTSHLLFAGDLIYKIKKPVRFPSMDLSRSDKRRLALANEFLMNQRLAPSIYLGVLALVEEGGRWRFEESAEPGEYALLMRRLPTRRMLYRLLDCNQVDSQMLAALARILERFHEQATPAQAMPPQNHVRTLEAIWASSLRQIRSFVGPILDRECFGVLHAFASSFIREHEHILARRASEGRIREIHGDLRCDHICYAPEGIQIFGSRRPLPRLRRQDTAWDVASVIVDLDLRGEARRAVEFLKFYLEFSGDRELPYLLPFYRSYCALARGKDEWFFSAGTSNEASRFFDYACSAARQPPVEPAV